MLPGNIGIARHPGQDFATFYDSIRNDVFAGYSDHSYMYADNFDGSLAYFNEVLYFGQVYAYSFKGRGRSSRRRSGRTRYWSRSCRPCPR